MKFPLPKILLASLLAAAFITLVGALYSWYATGTPDLLLFLRIALVTLGLLVLYQTVARHRPRTGSDRCDRCGSRTFKTRRSLDRRLVATCFRCGAETLSPPPLVRGPSAS